MGLMSFFRQRAEAARTDNFLARLRDLSARRDRDCFSQCTDWSILEWAGAAAGEAGEMANVAKKIRRDGWSPELKEALGKEIADTVIYLERIATLEGIDLEDAIRQKFNEVSDKVGFKERL